MRKARPACLPEEVEALAPTQHVGDKKRGAFDVLCVAGFKRFCLLLAFPNRPLYIPRNCHTGRSHPHPAYTLRTLKISRGSRRGGGTHATRTCVCVCECVCVCA